MDSFTAVAHTDIRGHVRAGLLISLEARIVHRDALGVFNLFDVAWFAFLNGAQELKSACVSLHCSRVPAPPSTFHFDKGAEVS